MTTPASIRSPEAPVETAAKVSKPRYFFGPVTDFLLLGGASLLLLPVALLLPNNAYSGILWATTVLALFINHPHFANSYQLFYRNFGAKAFSPEHKRMLRFRYILAGIAVPAALTLFLTMTIVIGERSVLGAAGNSMAFFVGWHYVKQGFGMLIVDGVLKRQFFTPLQRNILLANGYAVWAFTYISTNTGSADKALFGVDYYVLNLPVAFETVAIGVTAVTTLAALAVFAKKFAHNLGSVPLSGVTAYLVTLYLWMTFVRIDPIWLLIVPALHSMQYLTVVWRYQINHEIARVNEPTSPSRPGSLLDRAYRRHFATFVGTSVFLGLLGFWVVPLVLEAFVPLSAFGSEASVFIFAFWVFINVHHYFIDNVIWRSENPDVKRLLFEDARRSPSPPAAPEVRAA